MRIDISEGVAGDWAKAGKDIKNGDIVKILDSGQVLPSGYKDEDGKSKDQYVFKIRTKDTPPLNVALNKTSRINLGKGWGTETLEWVDKKCVAFVVKQMVGDGLKNVLYLAPEGWEMDEDTGDFFDPNAPETPTPKVASRPSLSTPTDDINPDDIPF